MNVKKHLINYRVIKPFLLMALSFLLVTGCNSSEIQLSDISTQRAPRFAECQVVEHPLGKTCIPLKPQRIILDSWFLDPLFALEVKGSIVGTTCPTWWWIAKGCVASGLSSDQIEGIETVGNYPPSLEKILLLKPDLILGSDSFKSIYKQLSNIAPTVLINWDDIKFSFKSYLLHIAQLFDREEVAKEILVQYQNRVAEVRKQLGDQLKNAEVSVIIYGCAGNNGFSVPPRYAIWFQILDDLGIKIKPIFSMSQEDWCTTFDSIETINNYDSDILFIANLHSKSGYFILEKPLVSSLNAVKNGRAYVIDGQDVWDVYGPLGVNRLLDLLSKHLLKAAQSF
ncbi:ABC transporter, iron(III) dicitrate-binding protein [Calothrix sp. PCC 7716]|nr:ABC transporter, iron(III) dicitrate-binding protein [Calothrix sp. PCC 7716]